MRVGVIGLGIMGQAMAERLLAVGHSVTVYNRTRAKAEPVLAQGARWAETPLPLNAITRELFVATAQHGWAEEDYSAAVKTLELLAGTELRPE
jgi:3-hydroxyisobutyrate dehydrogenase